MKNKLTTIKGLENGRAKFAYECAEEGKKTPEYKAHIKKLPVLIKTNGLGAALAFYKSKKESHKLIYGQITKWLKMNDYIDPKSEDLVKEIIGFESQKYRAITIEVLSFTKWLSRFADGLIEGGEDEND